MSIILIEQNIDGIGLMESGEGASKKHYLSGVFMEAEKKNRNGRVYQIAEMTREVDRIQAAINEGRHMLGELDHPAGSLEISLKNVSHKITEMKMVNGQAVGKAEILEKTQSGAILKGLVESGVQVGVSSRGKGQLDESGRVSNFQLVTIDAVAVPSAHNAYPTSIMESLEAYHRGEIVNDLAEAVIHDSNAQKYFLKEVQQFIRSMKLD